MVGLKNVLIVTPLAASVMFGGAGAKAISFSDVAPFVAPGVPIPHSNPSPVPAITITPPKITGNPLELVKPPTAQLGKVTVPLGPSVGAVPTIPAPTSSGNDPLSKISRQFDDGVNAHAREIAKAGPAIAKGAKDVEIAVGTAGTDFWKSMGKGLDDGWRVIVSVHTWPYQLWQKYQEWAHKLPDIIDGLKANLVRYAIIAAGGLFILVTLGTMVGNLPGYIAGRRRA